MTMTMRMKKKSLGNKTLLLYMSQIRPNNPHSQMGRRLSYQLASNTFWQAIDQLFWSLCWVCFEFVLGFLLSLFWVCFGFILGLFWISFEVVLELF
jgi:hypothetical protein